MPLIIIIIIIRWRRESVEISYQASDAFVHGYNMLGNPSRRYDDLVYYTYRRTTLDELN